MIASYSLRKKNLSDPSFFYFYWFMDTRGSVRKTVSLPPAIALEAVRRCGSVKGKFSAYISNLIEKDLRGEVPRLSTEQRREVLSLFEEAAARDQTTVKKKSVPEKNRRTSAA